VLGAGFACTFSCWAQQASNNELPLVWVLSPGGTIAGTGNSSTNVAKYKGSTILGEDLVNAVPEVEQFRECQGSADC
jgi:L-asparaginase